jgi:inner membrane protein
VDPITQVLLGAAAAHSVFSRSLGRAAILIGAVAGELADVDVFFTPWLDPEIPFELHRHFTHSLAFIPIGGVIAAMPFLLVPALRRRWKSVVGAAVLAYATHPPLDNCTSYGTHLLWPFTDARTAWDCMSIIDPIFTGFLFLGVLIALIVGRARPSRIGLACALSYILLGFVQHARVKDVQETLAASRGHEIEFGRVMPTLGNLVIWRSVYESGGMLHADAVRLLPWGKPLLREGESAPAFRIGDIPIRVSSRVHEVVRAHVKFATGMASRIESDGAGVFLIGDVRYSADPGGFEPIWGLSIDLSAPGGEARATGFGMDTDGALRRLWADMTQPGPSWRAVEDAARRTDPVDDARAPAAEELRAEPGRKTNQQNGGGHQ